MQQCRSLPLESGFGRKQRCTGELVLGRSGRRPFLVGLRWRRVPELAQVALLQNAIRHQSISPIPLQASGHAWVGGRPNVAGFELTKRVTCPSLGIATNCSEHVCLRCLQLWKHQSHLTSAPLRSMHAGFTVERNTHTAMRSTSSLTGGERCQEPPAL